MQDVLYQWLPSTPELETINQLAADLGISDLLARLLVNRGITNSKEADRFLQPSLSGLHDPFLMKGMEVAVERVSEAIESKEELLIYGDYDVDGITSTVALRRALEMLGGRVKYYIPKRLEEGYGLRLEVLEKAHADGIRLMITVDSGIRDFEVCKRGRELGVDVIVTDHHLPDRELPPAYAILNPRQPDCTYPEKDLAAVGVVLKLVQALFEKYGKSSVVHHFLKVVAIGTVADMVPLVGENRIIVKHGLDALSQPHNLGLQTLLNGAGIGGSVDQFDIGFKLAPRINAFTRMGGGSEIVDLFSVNDPGKASAIVEEMNNKNVQRRAEEEQILAEVEAQFEANPDLFRVPFILAAGQEWHRGVIGNVASRIAERFYRPTLVISTSEDRCQGSGRSIPGFHLLEALDCCSRFFEKHGGHAQAVGCTLKQEFADKKGIRQLSEALQAYADSVLSAEDLVPSLTIDAVLDVEDVNPGLCKDLERLGPFGIGNPVPSFTTEQVPISRGPWILKEQHLKLELEGNGRPLDVIWWRNKEAARGLEPGTPIDLVYSVSCDTYRGQEKILLTVKDMRSQSPNRSP